MTASPTATNRATPSSSGPKVTARGRCPPTQLSSTLETECLYCLSTGPTLLLAQCRFVTTLSTATQQEMCLFLQPLPLTLHLLLPLPVRSLTPDDPLLVPCGSLQAWTLVVWAATSMTRSPVQWPSLEPSSHLPPQPSSLFSSPHWPSSHRIIEAFFFFLFLSTARLCVRTWDNQPSAPDSSTAPRPLLFYSPPPRSWQIYHHEEWCRIA